MKQIERVKEFGGWLERYTHQSTCCQCEMTFSVYLPPIAQYQKVPALYWLSGLTCTDDNFRTKAGAQRYAAEHGIALIIPDTSPRGDDVPDEADRYDLGKGAGFYVDATQPRWAKNYQMYSYITEELVQLVEANFAVVPGRKSISGHSMGGHGALMIALRNPGEYQSASAFAPICNPVACAWGQGCFGEYLGDDTGDWATYDTVALIQSGAQAPPLLVSQGTADEFLEEQLQPQKLVTLAASAKVIELEYDAHGGYDHSYHFIGSFIGQHISWHAEHLGVGV